MFHLVRRHHFYIKYSSSIIQRPKAIKDSLPKAAGEAGISNNSIVSNEAIILIGT